MTNEKIFHNNRIADRYRYYIHTYGDEQRQRHGQAVTALAAKNCNCLRQ